MTGLVKLALGIVGLTSGNDLDQRAPSVCHSTFGGVCSL